MEKAKIMFRCKNCGSDNSQNLSEVFGHEIEYDQEEYDIEMIKLIFSCKNCMQDNEIKVFPLF